jgi:type IV secretory pathway VirB10-like protein
MAERALGHGSVTPSSVWVGSKLAIAKIVVPALLIGAGIGAIWARTLFDHPPAQPRPEARSFPLNVEDVDPSDPAVRDLPVPPSAAASDRVATADSQPQAALRPKAPDHALRAHAGHAAHAPKPRTEPLPVEPVAAAVPESAAAPPQASHHLADELRLMRSASDALADSDVPRTLQLLSEHAEKFPEGALREERRALRVIALCKQGRSHFALVERDEFLSSSPRSPLTARVREACESSQ